MYPAFRENMKHDRAAPSTARKDVKTGLEAGVSRLAFIAPVSAQDKAARTVCMSRLCCSYNSFGSKLPLLFSGGGPWPKKHVYRVVRTTTEIVSPLEPAITGGKAHSVDTNFLLSCANIFFLLGVQYMYIYFPTRLRLVLQIPSKHNFCCCCRQAIYAVNLSVAMTWRRHLRTWYYCRITKTNPQRPRMFFCGIRMLFVGIRWASWTCSYPLRTWRRSHLSSSCGQR